MRQLLSARVRLLEMEDGPPSLQEEVGAIAACAKGAQMPVDSASKRDTDTMAEAAGAETAAIVGSCARGEIVKSAYLSKAASTVEAQLVFEFPCSDTGRTFQSPGYVSACLHAHQSVKSSHLDALCPRLCLWNLLCSRACSLLPVAMPKIQPPELKKFMDKKLSSGWICRQ